MNKEFGPNSLAVNTRLSIEAEVINRLANNSNICKTLAITLAGAIIGFDMTLGPLHVVFVIAALLMLMYLDSLYMGLKKRSQRVSTLIIRASRDGLINPYKIVYDGKKTNMGAFCKGVRSSTVWPFYAIAIAGVALLYFHPSAPPRLHITCPVRAPPAAPHRPPRTMHPGSPRPPQPLTAKSLAPHRPPARTKNTKVQKFRNNRNNKNLSFL